MEKKSKPKGYWAIKENCFKEAEKYRTLREFEKSSHTCCMMCRKNGWLDDFTWMKKNTSHGWWKDKQHCEEEARKYETLNDFMKKSVGCYIASKKYGFLKEFTWLAKKTSGVKSKWTYELAYKKAKEYSTLKDFVKENCQCYNVCRKNDWIKDFTWLKRSHIANHWTKEKCYETALKYTTLKEFRESEPVCSAKAVREGWADEYIWLKRREMKSRGYWTREMVEKEASKYVYQCDFQKYAGGAFCRAKEDGYLDNLGLIKKSSVWTSNDLVYAYEFKKTNSVYVGRTLEHRKQLRDIEHRTRDDSQVYRHSKKYGIEIPEPIILKVCDVVNEGLYWEDWYVKHYLDNGWNVLNKAKTGVKSGSIGGNVHGPRKWKKNKVVEISKQYETLLDFHTYESGAYEAARKGGYLYELFEQKCLPPGYWTKERCKKEAEKYTSQKEFKRCSSSAYEKSRKHGWDKEYTWLSKTHSPSGYWNYEQCYRVAKSCNSRSEFFKLYGSAYNVSLTNGWINEWEWLSPKKKRNYYTYDICYEIAKSCKCVSEMSKKSARAYEVARINGWIKEYTWFEHLKK